LHTRRRWWADLEVEWKVGKERRRGGEEEVGERAADAWRRHWWRGMGEWRIRVRVKDRNFIY
jgi:hypothetical protein